jgi:hypothetical protein
MGATWRSGAYFDILSLILAYVHHDPIGRGGGGWGGLREELDVGRTGRGTELDRQRGRDRCVGVEELDQR